MELGELFKAKHEASIIKRASNRESSAELLIANGIQYSSHNGSAHLIVEGPTCPIDFWPGTGKWISRDKTKGFGVFALIKYIKENKN